MNKDALRTLILQDKELAPHVDYILSIAKPSVDINVSEETPDDGGCRLGGDPNVPAGFTWPVHDIGEYRFLGQFNFTELDNPPAALPVSGLLSLFYAYDEDGEVFWRDPGYIIGYYWPDQTGFSVQNAPQAGLPKTRKITLNTRLDLPRHAELRDDWSLDEDDLDALLYWRDSNDAYLLGYPSFTSLAYDPTPKGDWVSLLTIHSLDAFDWCWHDGDKLMVFIEADRLEKCDFSRLASDAG